MSPYRLALMSLLVAGSAWAAPPRIAVYQSESNAATYHGLNEEPLRIWLTHLGHAFDVIGDAQATDAAKLGEFAAIITSSCYLPPPAACAGLSQYVANGGHLLWIDAPSRCEDGALKATLGIPGACAYSPVASARFRIQAPQHPACAGVNDFTTSCVGNPALASSGKVLATYTGKTASAKAATTFPALTQTRTGKGYAFLFNWILWSDAVDDGRNLLAGALAYCLADASLRDAPFVLALSCQRAQVAQPNPVVCNARVFAHADAAARGGSLRMALRDPRGATAVAGTDTPIRLQAVPDDALSFANATVSLATDRLPDGVYSVVATGRLDAGRMPRIVAAVELNGEALARLAKEERARAALLRPLIQGSLGDYDLEPRTPAGRVDIPRLLKEIEAAHMTMYDFLIFHADTDWEDFQVFVREAKQRNLKVWITLTPPSEPPFPQPFGLDYIKWADEIGKLSRTYDNLVAFVIDDFWSGENRSLFTPSYIARLASALRAQNPKVAFLPTVYWATIGDQRWMEDYHSSIDGIMFPYAPLKSTKELPAQLHACRQWIGPDKLLVINVYATGSSGDAAQPPRTPGYIRSMLEISHKMCDAIREYCLNKEDFNDPLFAITAQLYGKWSQPQK